MEEPSRRTSRLTIAGAALALTGAMAAGFALGRSTGEPEPAPPAAVVPTPTPAPAPAPVLPTIQPPLGRADLIGAAARAADAFAAGQPLPADLTELAGRNFELKLAFGCPGAPQTGDGALSAEYDPDAEVLRVRAESVSWNPEEWIPTPAGVPDAAPAADAIEGFWIARPWTSSQACPAAPALGIVPSAADQTLGIAQVHRPEGSRLGRRDGKPFNAVDRVAPDALDTSRGLRLRLQGKLARTPGPGPVICRAPDGARPACLLLVNFDQVAVENPATGATIATWDMSSQARDRAER